MIKLKYNILYVPNVDTAISFYERAFGFERQFITPDSNYGELKTGETTLSFANETFVKENIPGGFQESRLGKKPFGIELGFTTRNVEEVYQNAILEGAKALVAPKTKPWGQVVAYVQDPNGFLLEICTPMD